MNKETELKSCPFCGGVAYLINLKNLYESITWDIYAVGCKKEGCFGQAPHMNLNPNYVRGYAHQKEENAVEHWNKRAVEQIEPKDTDCKYCSGKGCFRCDARVQPTQWISVETIKISELKQIIFEDVPHKYQDRLLKIAKEMSNEKI